MTKSTFKTKSTKMHLRPQKPLWHIISNAKKNDSRNLKLIHSLKPILPIVQTDLEDSEPEAVFLLVSTQKLNTLKKRNRATLRTPDQFKKLDPELLKVSLLHKLKKLTYLKNKLHSQSNKRLQTPNTLWNCQQLKDLNLLDLNNLSLSHKDKRNQLHKAVSNHLSMTALHNGLPLSSHVLHLHNSQKTELLHLHTSLVPLALSALEASKS